MKDYIVRFDKEAVRVENYKDAVALTAIMPSLRPRRFHNSLTKNALRSFTKLLLRALEYFNANELTNVKKISYSDFQKPGEKKEKKG